MAISKSQSELIRQAAEQAIRRRDKYTQEQIDSLLKALEAAEKEVKLNLLRYDNLGSLTGGKKINQKALRQLQKQVSGVMTELEKNHSLTITKAIKTTYKQGMYDSIGALVKGKLPFYNDLTDKGIEKMTGNVFQLVDTHALDFMANFNIQLAGEVSRELKDGINQVISQGIATGKGAPDIVKDLGSVIKDQEAFRRAGKTVFKTAQTRMTLIARTETIRAHNQGQIKFYHTVGVEKAIWQTAEDERTCPECAPLDEQIYDLGKLPSLPYHPSCRCWSVPEIPDTIKTPQEIEESAGSIK
ncbi:MAG: minor capsid protein [Candidatus Schekmanbacteria bacterium]|nr:minor capsid protein [Candidatus Schekmanbacteria bacterium]